jgi:hypothetical protein
MPAVNVRVPLKDFSVLLNKLGKKAEAAAQAGVLSASLRAQAIVVAESQRKGVFNTGYYVGAWKTARSFSGGGSGFTVFNQAPYAGVIENGRRPYPPRASPSGKPKRPKGSGPIPMDALPPFRKAIAAWVMRKFSLPYESAYPLMWVISNSINRKGIPGRYVLRDAIPLIEDAANKEIERELNRAMTGKP